MTANFSLPLMEDNITREDINCVVEFLSQDPIPKLTNGPKVVEFEQKWSEWLGVKYSLMVNSGASANELTMLAVKFSKGSGEVIVPPLTWSSDLSSVIFAGMKPVFCDINLKNLSFDMEELKKVVTKNTKAIFVTHVLGLNALTDELIDFCKEKDIVLIEDVCESHGATFKNQKVGTFGLMSNFSFYFAHHMSTIEGGMICTNDNEIYQFCRAIRSHGMIREMTDDSVKERFYHLYPDLNKDFIFIGPGKNARSTEINAVIGLSQIKRLDSNNSKRIDNFNYFLSKLDSSKYHTELDTEGQCNYAFIVIMKEPSMDNRDHIERTLKASGIEFRRGLSGGGNQVRQPFYRSLYKQIKNDLKNTDHVHSYSWYIGNYPSLGRESIDRLLQILNTAI
jgi:CDP-6-deoxy-D-xylo-4-hexulose-3-dehydrase